MISVCSFGRSGLDYSGRRRASFRFAIRTLFAARRRWPSGRPSLSLRPSSLFASSPSFAPVSVMWSHSDGLCGVLLQFWWRG